MQMACISLPILIQKFQSTIFPVDCIHFKIFVVRQIAYLAYPTFNQILRMIFFRLMLDIY